MTYEEAKRLAIKLSPTINACREYTVAYHFYDRHDKELREPGGDVVILKETGAAIGLALLMQEYYPIGRGKRHPF